MSWLNPLGLIGLLSLPVVLVLHLLRERQRRYLVSALSLWDFLDQEVRGPRTRRLPLTPLLLLDLLVAALLSLAWAQPRLERIPPPPTARRLVLLIDVSSSMLAADGAGAGSRFATAKAAAAELLRSAGRLDRVTILAFGSRVTPVGDSRTDSADLLAVRLGALQAGETGSVLDQALAVARADVDPALPAEFHIFTDGSFSLPGGSVAAGEGEQQFPYPLQWHWFGRATDNQALLDVSAVRVTSDRVQVFARVANFGASAAARPVIVELDGRVVERALIEIPPESAAPWIWQPAIDPAAPPSALHIRLEGGDSLPADDSASLGLQPGRQVRVAIVADNPAPLLQAVRAIPGTAATVVRPQDYAARALDGREVFDLTIFRDYLPPSWPSGTSLIIEPPNPAAEVEPPLAILRGAPQALAADAIVRTFGPDPFTAGIDFSGVRWGRAWTLGSFPPDFETLLQAGDLPLLLYGPVRSAQGAPADALLLTVDLSRGNFTKHPAFPITIANLVEHARRAPLPGQIQSGQPAPLPDPAAFQALEIAPPAEEALRLSAPWAAEWRGALIPGLYRFRLIDSSGAPSEFALGVNAGDPDESDLRPRPWVEEVADGPGGLFAALDAEPQPLDLWPWLLAAAIAGLVIEAWLAWRR